MADRYYLTTSIAYANNQPGLHTLYEVIAADAIARWYRMKGVPTRFLTGTDEHSINIAQSALDEGRSPRAFVDEKVDLFVSAEAALGISPDRFIRTTDPDHVRAAQEMVRRAYANGDIYLGTYEGWYCPNEGFRNASDVLETAEGTICPNHPGVPLQWLTERNWFFRLSAYQERLERHFAEHPEFVEPDYRRNEMLGFIRQGLEDFSISRERTPGDWGIPFPIAENGETSLREDGSWDPEAGKIYVWYDALINYITGAGFPDDAEAFGRWWPADLHIIGKDIARFHTIFWPAMLWSAGLEAPRKVWVHGFMAVQGEKMSKSRGNFLDPNDFVQTFGTTASATSSCARSRSIGTRSVVGPVRPPLQRGPRQRFRQPGEPDGVDGESVPRRRAAGTGGRVAGGRRSRCAPDLPRTARGKPPARCPRGAVVARRGRKPVRRQHEAVGPQQGSEGRRRCRRRDVARGARRPCRSVPARGPCRRPVHARCSAARPGATRATPIRTARTAMAGRRCSMSCAGAPIPLRPAGSAPPSHSSPASRARLSNSAIG